MGILSQKIIESSEVDISCQPIIGETETKNETILNCLKKTKNHNLGIMFAYPDMYPVLNEYQTKVIYTGVDSTGGIPNFSNNSNHADFILTPSFKSKERMEKLGVIKPIYVFPHGIDPEVFKFKERKKSDKFKFLYVGECSDRKGIFQLLESFVSLFKGNSKVELHIKSNTDMIFYNGDEIKKIIEENSNILWHISDEGHEKVLELYNDCHVYVYPSRADTFGMTLLEAMACGLPIISTSEPGATELIKDRYLNVMSKNVSVKNHPWMLGEWGEADVEVLKMLMKEIYERYDYIISNKKLKENSDFVRNNYSWKKVTENFDLNILPKLNKKTKILTLLTSYDRPHHIKNVINSIKNIRENGYLNHVYIVENSGSEYKEQCLNIIKENIDSGFTLYDSDFNMGQRGSLLQMLEDVNIDEYDFIQFTDQDNIFEEPLSTYCSILNENLDFKIVTGYMSKEHSELGWKKTRHGNLCEKRTCRAGHMFIRTSDFKTLYPIHLDSQFNQPYNSSWNAGLDWEIQYWNPNSFGRKTNSNFILCLPGGVIHKGVDSTMYEWPVEENEYSLEELVTLRNK
jgi:glycosyltransferase involved in cell wall biosynthesis